MRKKRIPATEETRNKLREAMLGRKITWGEKISKGLTGKKLSVEHRKHLSESHKGQKAWNKGLRGYYVPTVETIEKLRAVHLGRRNTKATKRKMSESALIAQNRPEQKDRLRLTKLAGKNPQWKGGRYKNTHGYVVVYAPNHPAAQGNKALEHRVVVEKILGRYLLPKEIVHHLGERDDNRINKLMVFKNNTAHFQFHRHPEKVKEQDIVFDGRSYV